jgi:hypothetical protein
MPTLKRRWKAHTGQQPILNSDARFRICAAGRRFGKSNLAAHELIERGFANPGSLNWWVAPSHGTANIGFEFIEDILPPSWIADTKRSPPKYIETPNETKFEFLSTSSDTALVGSGVDFIVIDEAAQVPDIKWRRDLRPTLTDTLGSMLAISTPRTRNWFHDYFQRGQSPDHPDVESWQKSTYENPHVPDSEIDDAREELPEAVFEQEYMAIFRTDDGNVFKEVRERVVEDYDYEAFEGEPPYTTGVDFGRQDAHTVIVTLDSEGSLVAFRRLQSPTWPEVQRAIETIDYQYPASVRVDATRDNKIVADLERGGVRVEPINFSGQRKRRLIENLIAFIEAGEIRLPEIPPLLSELEMFEQSVTRGGTPRYHAPQGFQDDGVDALSLAAFGNLFSLNLPDRPEHHGVRTLG